MPGSTHRRDAAIPPVSSAAPWHPEPEHPQRQDPAIPSEAYALIAMPEWIAVVRIPPEVERKLRARHNVTGDEVREAVGIGRPREARLHREPTRGERLLVKGVTYANRRLIVVLRPVDRNDGIWACVTAMDD